MDDDVIASLALGLLLLSVGVGAIVWLWRVHRREGIEHDNWLNRH
jgi:hypothetical protein